MNQKHPVHGQGCDHEQDHHHAHGPHCKHDQEPVRNPLRDIGRSDLCPCGSQKTFNLQEISRYLIRS
ncbi:SEC-C metal-binding domain-containing protein [Azomonas macrocytogenes]|uniref:SEC-C metal-binding domain-containing protein n=1 Tax=Azomonas macrocytogenes TaxID=69962 RepID=UPI00160562F3